MSEPTLRRSRALTLTPADIHASSLSRYRDIVDDWDAFAEALCRPLDPLIWANPSRIDVEALRDLLAEEGLDPRPVPGLPEALRLAPGTRPGQHWWYCAGLAHAQELVSQLPVRLMDLHPGQRVLDLCAAPGGKTAQMAFALDNRGTLIANDLSIARLKALQGNLDRLGVVNVSTTCSDGANWPAAGGQFDRILVDAPCSSEGTLRRNGALLGRLDPDNSARLAPRQHALLRQALRRCRPGGRVLYSTCTFAPEENELIVAGILAEFGDLVRLLPVRLPAEIRTAPGLSQWQGQRLPQVLEGCARLWPHHNDSGGFFMALLEKDASAPAEPPPEPAALSSGADVEAWLDGLEARYGLGHYIRTHYRVHRRARRGLHLVAADHEPPRAPRAEASGLFFHRTNVRPPKPTTGGALLLGRAAQGHRIELDAEQRDRYLRRESIEPTPEQRAATPLGQLFACYRGQVLGMAVLHRSGLLESLFPSRWSGCTAGGAEADSSHSPDEGA